MNNVGVVTEKEKQEIQDIYERKVALESLLNIIDSDKDYVYNKLINDYSSTLFKFNKWWDDMANKYQWIGSQFQIDFSTNEIFNLK